MDSLIRRSTSEGQVVVEDFARVWVDRCMGCRHLAGEARMNRLLRCYTQWLESIGIEVFGIGVVSGHSHDPWVFLNIDGRALRRQCLANDHADVGLHRIMASSGIEQRLDLTKEGLARITLAKADKRSNVTLLGGGLNQLVDLAVRAVRDLVARSVCASTEIEAMGRRESIEPARQAAS